MLEGKKYADHIDKYCLAQHFSFDSGDTPVFCPLRNVICIAFVDMLHSMFKSGVIEMHMPVHTLGFQTAESLRYRVTITNQHLPCQNVNNLYTRRVHLLRYSIA